MATTINFPSTPSVNQTYTYGTTTYVWDGIRWHPEYTSSFEVIQLAVSDETSAISIGANKVKFRMPYAMTITSVRASTSIAAAGPAGDKVIVDINENGTSILSTKLTIDVSQTTSTTAAVPVVISDTNLADDSEISIDIDGVGDYFGGAGLKVTLIGTRN
jgi:hypothetical protein